MVLLGDVPKSTILFKAQKKKGRVKLPLLREPLLDLLLKDSATEILSRVLVLELDRCTVGANSDVGHVLDDELALEHELVNRAHLGRNCIHHGLVSISLVREKCNLLPLVDNTPVIDFIFVGHQHINHSLPPKRFRGY